MMMNQRLQKYLLRAAAYKCTEMCKIKINDYVITSPLNLAITLSEKVHTSYLADPTSKDFEFILDKIDENIIKSTESLLTKGIIPQNIQDGQLKAFYDVGVAAGIDELSCPYFEYMSKQEITLENVFEQINFFEKYETPTKQIDYLAANFYQFEDDKLFDFISKKGINLFLDVLSNKKLIIKNRKWIVEFVTRLMKLDSSFVQAIKFLCFKNVPENVTNEFIRFIDEYVQQNAILQSFWDFSKSMIMKNPVQLKCNESTILINYTGNDKNGIFAYLMRNNGNNNPIDSGIVKVSVIYDSAPSGDIIDYNRNSQWGLKEIVNNALIFDFVSRKVALNAYTISSGRPSSYWDYPVNFAIEGSNDNLNWEMIDNKPNNSEMGGDYKIHTWVCQKSKPFRYIRFRLVSIHQSGNLFTRYFEFFGDLIEEK